MSLSKPSALVKPTHDTKFHIDYDWWERTQEDLHYYLLSHLQKEHREQLAEMPENEIVDYIDPETGEIHQMDALQLAIQESARSPEFITDQVSLVDAIFRVFLKNNNRPMTTRELADQVGRDAETILKTIGGRHIYKGIRPV